MPLRTWGRDDGLWELPQIKGEIVIKAIYDLVEGVRRGSKAVSRLQHRRNLPAISHPFDRDLLNSLKLSGAFVTHLADMEQAGFAGCADLLSSAKPLFAPKNLVTSSRSKSFLQHSSDAAVSACPGIVIWGLQDRLLSLIEAYIGLPVAYRGVIARRDIADGRQSATRYWHRDGEDVRIIKIIVYVDDVRPDDGPFCYVPKPLAPHSITPMFDGNRVVDKVFDSAVSSHHQVSCVGSAGTVVFADTCSVWHRGSVGTKSDRSTLFFCYNSQMPLSPEDCRPMKQVMQLNGETMTDRQRIAVDVNY